MSTEEMGREEGAEGPAPALSVIVPALDEERGIAELFGDLRRLTVPHEVIVVDGGSRDATPALAREAGAQVVSSRAGRGAQLRLGARIARAPLLFFVHADVRLEPASVRRLDALARTPAREALAFRLRIDAERYAFRVVERTANVRSRWLKMPYGDQGLIVRRECYEAAGGYPGYPLMEDVALVRTLRRVCGVGLLPEEIRVSARRWERDGIVRRTAHNWLLVTRFLLGADPATLVRGYRPESGHD
jgi:rSAM/selenodomain-associated transferase 2